MGRKREKQLSPEQLADELTEAAMERRQPVDRLHTRPDEGTWKKPKKEEEEEDR